MSSNIEKNQAKDEKPEYLPMSPLSLKAGDPLKPNLLEVVCSFCESKEVVRRGWRQTKRGKVQLFKRKSCVKTFTPSVVKGKHYPLAIILDAISLYNLGFSAEQTAGLMKQIITAGQNKRRKTKANLQPSSVLSWVEEYKPLCRYFRLRPFAVKMFGPRDVLESATLAHRQLYRFRFHRAKTRLIMQDDFKHNKFGPLEEFLRLVTSECPHQYFQEGQRASESPIKFSKTDMIVRAKKNYANWLARTVLGAIREPKQRHEALQKFMLANDSVTVATEVPVYLKQFDLAHMQTQLGFKMFIKKEGEYKEIAPADLPRLITGHIDFIQIRNGAIHIMDYKPNAAKERPIEQLTLYALAMSRLTGLRLFHFKCAWFDENDYFEFFPLHVVYKRKRKRRRVYTMEGIYNLNQKLEKIENLRPAVL